MGSALTGDFRVDFQYAGIRTFNRYSIAIGLFDTGTLDASGNLSNLVFGMREGNNPEGKLNRVLIYEDGVEDNTYGVPTPFITDNRISFRRTGSEIAIWVNGEKQSQWIHNSSATVYPGFTSSKGTSSTSNRIYVCEVDGAAPPTGTLGSGLMRFDEDTRILRVGSGTETTGKRAGTRRWLDSADTGDLSYFFRFRQASYTASGMIGIFDTGGTPTAANNNKNFHLGLEWTNSTDGYVTWEGSTSSTTNITTAANLGDIIEFRRTGTTHAIYINGVLEYSMTKTAADAWPACVGYNGGSANCEAIHFNGNMPSTTDGYSGSAIVHLPDDYPDCDPPGTPF